MRKSGRKEWSPVDSERSETSDVGCGRVGCVVLASTQLPTNPNAMSHLR